MKRASFFLISAAFHGALLALPVSFREAGVERVIPVVLVHVLEKAGPATPENGAGRTLKRTPGFEGDTKSATLARTLNGKSDARTSGHEEPIRVRDFVADDPHRLELEPTMTDPILPVASMRTGATTEVFEETFEDSPAGPEKSANRAGGSDRKEGSGTSSRGAAGNGSSKLTFVQARYAHNPKPEYPDRARREGWEGTVILRVLVDPEGMSKQVELSGSSGFEALDAAAKEAVKGWRFYPARYGQEKIKSWVRVPIVFKLEERGSF